MRRALFVFPILSALMLAGCGDRPLFPRKEAKPDPQVPEIKTPPPIEDAPPPNARTAEQFDTTTPDERQKAASAPKPAGETLLGETVASLGDPASPGFWMETPLVTSVVQGRVENPATGKSAKLELRPITGPSTAGSRLSLAAMRLVGASLTDLPTLKVFSGG